MNNNAFLGIAQKGRFISLAAETESGGLFRLTRIPVQAGQTPESAEISLDQYDGLAILVRGISQGEWIYSAEVVEQAGEILSVVVQAVFGESGKRNIKFPMG